jgi:hypothetical protein
MTKVIKILQIKDCIRNASTRRYKKNSLQKIRKFVTVHAVRANVGVKVYLHSFLTSTLDGGEWSTSQHGHITPEDKVPVELMFKNTY